MTAGGRLPGQLGRPQHASGDELIRVIARTMAAELRPGDLLARTGGDEFLALLPDASPQGGVRAAQRILAALLEVELPWKTMPASPSV